MEHTCKSKGDREIPLPLRVHPVHHLAKKASTGARFAPSIQAWLTLGRTSALLLEARASRTNRRAAFLMALSCFVRKSARHCPNLSPRVADPMLLFRKGSKVFFWKRSFDLEKGSSNCCGKGLQSGEGLTLTNALFLNPPSAFWERLICLSRVHFFLN